MPAGTKAPQPVLWPKLQTGSQWFVEAWPIACEYEGYEDAFRVKYYDEATHKLSAILLHADKIEHYFNFHSQPVPPQGFKEFVKATPIPVYMAARIWHALSAEKLGHMVNELARQFEKQKLSGPAKTEAIQSKLGVNSQVKILDGPHLNKTKKDLVGKIGTVFALLPDIKRQAPNDNTIRIGVRFSDAKHPGSKLFRDIVWLWADNLETVKIVTEEAKPVAAPASKITPAGKASMIEQAKSFAEHDLKNLSIYRPGDVGRILTAQEIDDIDWEETCKLGVEKAKVKAGDFEDEDENGYYNPTIDEEYETTW